jgi:hypothetical protein
MDNFNDLITICSPIRDINGIEAFIVHFNRRCREGGLKRDRIAVQMPGHIVLANNGFSDEEVKGICGYIDSNLPILVDMALERTEAGA